MKPDKIKKWLTDEEWRAYENAIKPGLSLKYKTLIKALENLAACRALSERRRALLKKHEWPIKIKYRMHKFDMACAECKRKEKDSHTPDCVWDAALKGEGGE